MKVLGSLIFVYLLCSLILGLFFYIPYGTGLSVELWLSLPLAVFFAYCVYANREALALGSRKYGKDRYRYFALVVLYCLVLFNSWPYVMVFNVLGYTPKPVILSGPITNKWISYGRGSHGYGVTFLNASTGTGISLIVSQAQYDSVSVGDLFEEKMLMGRMGLLYKWNLSQ